MNGKVISEGSVAGVIDKWSWKGGENFVGSELTRAIVDYDPGFYHGWPCPEEMEGLYPQFRKVKPNYNHPQVWRRVTTCLVFCDVNYEFFMKWFESRAKPRNKRNFGKLIFMVNRVAQKNEESLLKFVDEMVYIDDDLVNKLQDKIYRDNFFKDWKKLANKHTDAVFMMSMGPSAAAVARIMWETNPSNSYIDVGSALDPMCKGVNTRTYQNPKDPQSRKICRPFTLDFKRPYPLNPWDLNVNEGNWRRDVFPRENDFINYVDFL